MFHKDTKTRFRSVLLLGAGVALAACGAPGESGAQTETLASTSCAPPGSGSSGPDSGAPPGNGTGTKGADAGSAAPGFFQTSGGHIVDSSGATVRLTGVSWFGLETATYAPHGLWARGMGSMLDQIKSLGFNVIRVPFSNQLFDAGSTPNGIDLTKNPDLAGLTGLQILDKLVSGAKLRGLRILLDRHRPDSGAQSALWYTDRYSEQRWIADWTMLAARYAKEPTVIGADLHNEPHANATWGDGSAPTDWRLAAERAGNAILAVHPGWLIVVEGVEAVANKFYWWGGNLRAAGAAGVRLAVANRVVYSPHDYPPSVYNQPWFTAPGFPGSLASLWDQTWGYLAKTDVAPILIGEFGTKYESTPDKQWLGAMVDYIAQNKLSYTFWSWNADSGDTGGILMDDWQTVRADKIAVLKPSLAPPL